MYLDKNYAIQDYLHKITWYLVVCKKNAEKQKRVKRGLYEDGSFSWNADCVGAFNILRLYFQTNGMENRLNPMEIKCPYIVKVAV